MGLLLAIIRKNEWFATVAGTVADVPLQITQFRSGLANVGVGHAFDTLSPIYVTNLM